MADRLSSGSHQKDRGNLLSIEKAAGAETFSNRIPTKSAQKNSPQAPNPLRKPSVDSPMMNFDFKSIRPKDKSSFKAAEGNRRVSFKQQLEILEDNKNKRKESDSVVWPEDKKDPKPAITLITAQPKIPHALSQQLLSPESRSHAMKPTRIESEDRNQQAQLDQNTSHGARFGSSPNRITDVRPTLISSEAEGFSPVAARSELNDDASFKLRAKKQELERVEERLRKIQLEVNQLELEAKSEPPQVLVSQNLEQAKTAQETHLQFLSPSKDDELQIQNYDIRLESEDGPNRVDGTVGGFSIKHQNGLNTGKATSNGNSNSTPNPFELSPVESPKRLTTNDIMIKPFQSSSAKPIEPQIVVSGPTDFRAADSADAKMRESMLRRQNTPNFLQVSSSSEPKQHKQLLPPEVLQELEYIIYNSRLVGISQTMDRLNTFIQKHQIRKTGFQLISESDSEFTEEPAQMTPDKLQRSAQISELQVRYNSPPNTRHTHSLELEEQLGSQSRRLLLLKMERELMLKQQPVNIGSRVKLSLSIDGTGRSFLPSKRSQSRNYSGTFQHSKSVETASADLRSAIRVNSKTFDAIPEDASIQKSAVEPPKKVLIMPHIYKSATGGRIRSPVRPAVEVVKDIGSLEAQKIKRAGKLPALLRRPKKPSLLSPYYESDLDQPVQRC